MFPRLLVAAVAVAITLTAPAVARAGSLGSCSRNVDLLSFSDALDKTSFQGTSVGGLSALALDHGAARAIVDNEGSTPARIYDLALGRDGTPRVTGLTVLRRPDGTPYTGQDFDGEGLVALADSSVLASSETEPSIRRFSRSGRQLQELPVPDRFRVTPAGEAAVNLTFEGLGLSPDRRTLWAGMEGPLSVDGATPEGGARLRFLRYAHDRGGAWNVAGEVGYAADPGLGVTEVQVVGHGQLLVLERGFQAGVGNTVRLYQAFLEGADDVSDEPTLARDGLHMVVKRLLADLGDCPTAGATSPGTQRNPLLDNIEALAVGPRLHGGGRLLLLASDDNFSAGQVTRLYALRARLPGEAVLEARALYDALKFQPGPVSGATGVALANGVTPPFQGQPVPGFSGLLADRGGTFWGMPDNGFGSKDNSRDFLLRVYHVTPRWRTRSGGSGRLQLDHHISLRDPDHQVPFAIVNAATPERLLTGGDLDIESIQRDHRGNLWLGEEFGPFLVNTDPSGRVLRAPVPLPGVKSPQSPNLAPGEQPTLPGSRGFEATAASRDGRTLYPILEGALTTEADQTIRRIYEFDTAAAAYTGRTWSFHVDAPNLVVGDAQVLAGRRLLLIERDDLQGAAARIKRLVEIDLDAAPTADGTVPRRVVLDLLRIRDPFGISTPGPAGAIGLGDPFSFPLQSVESILPVGGNRVIVANDNNFPGSNGRVPGRPDDIEAIVLNVPNL